MAMDHSSTGVAGSPVFGLRSLHLAAIAAAAATTDRQCDRSPRGTVARAAGRQRVSDFVQDRITDTVLIVQVNEMTRQRNPFAAIVALSEANF